MPMDTGAIITKTKITSILHIDSHSIEQGGLKDREIKSLRRQLDSRDDELAEMTRGREVALKENRRLQTDLNTMTGEHQVSQKVIHHILHTHEKIFQ